MKKFVIIAAIALAGAGIIAAQQKCGKQKSCCKQKTELCCKQKTELCCQRSQKTCCKARELTDTAYKKTCVQADTACRKTRMQADTTCRNVRKHCCKQKK